MRIYPPRVSKPVRFQRYSPSISLLLHFLVVSTEQTTTGGRLCRTEYKFYRLTAPMASSSGIQSQSVLEGLQR
ncbi:hypothetical protein DEO72_LG9g1777 [Vigna unguiculata]|uniref:Uncharacterized protein n=1 Tax=Vigna unguiculata TaxID=3917 RepID=A0A4D6MZ31_VIGUN|nr:hypothetical protein DEO72_LG9g1777 [Vigna unguiculata]